MYRKLRGTCHSCHQSPKMSINITRLQHVRQRGETIRSQCPACAEIGADNTGNHLIVQPDGRFGCIVHTGANGIEHRKRIFALAGDTTKAADARPVPQHRPHVTAKASPRIPALRPLSVEEMTQITHVRGWHYFAGLQMLTNRGMLYHGDVYDDGAVRPAWIITDATRRNAQARRYDGQTWQGIGAKAKTLPGCSPAWPIGAAQIDTDVVLLCEGQPDFCAALLVSWFEGVPVSPVCMTGAGNSIHVDALQHFAGKHIRIATHDDDSGRDAGAKWARQLYGAGAATVDRFVFNGLAMADGQPVNDLADYSTLLGFDDDAPTPPAVLAGMTALAGIEIG